MNDDVPAPFDAFLPGMSEAAVRASGLGFKDVHPGRIGSELAWCGYPGRIWLDLVNGQVERLEIKLSLGNARGAADDILTFILEEVEASFGALVAFNGGPPPTAREQLDKLDHDARRFSKMAVAGAGLQPARPPGFSFSVKALRHPQPHYFVQLNLHR